MLLAPPATGNDEQASATQNAMSSCRAPPTSHGHIVAGPTSLSATPMMNTMPPIGAMGSDARPARS